MMTEPNMQAPPAPAPNSTWVTGYWHWTGAQYTWVPGHWETPPHGARWMGPRYSSRDGQYFYEAGRWDHTSVGGTSAGPQPQTPQAPPANTVANGTVRALR